MDNLSLRLHQTQRGACPLCGELLLHADHPPQSPHEWEQWVRTTGKAVAKRHLAYQERGTSDRSTLRLIHVRWHHRLSAEVAADSALLHRPRALGLA